MLTIRKLFVCLFVVLICLPGVVHAKTSERIKGVSEFLLDRFQENYVYIFEMRLKENKHFKFYFPATYSYVASGDLKFLLVANSGIWESSINKDIQEFPKRYLKKYFEDKKVIERFRDKLLKKEWVKEIQEEMASLDNIVTTIKKEGKAIDFKFNVDGKDYTYLTLKGKIESFEAELKAVKSTKKIEDGLKKLVTLAVSLEGMLTYVDKLREAFDNKKISYIDNFHKTLEDFKQKANKALAALQKVKVVKQQLQQLHNIVKATSSGSGNNNSLSLGDEAEKYSKNLSKSLQKHIKENAVSGNDKDVNFTGIIFSLEKVINNLRQMAGETVTSKDYRRFKQYILFFAQMADAKTAAETKALLVNITLPAVSFGIKRQRNEYQWLITSYLGLAAGVEDTVEENQHTKSFASLVAPVGIEVNYGFDTKNSLSFMYAPFDFGYPINLKLQEDDRTVELSDVISHGFYLTLGFEKSPVVLGVGASKGKSIRTDDRDEKKIFIFFAMDMPLFELY